MSKHFRQPQLKFEYKITLIYLIIGLLWIWFSDEVLAILFKDPELLTEFQSYKGSFYIIVTGLLLYLMVRNHMHKLNEQQSLFETMFNTITDGVIIANTHREIIMANNSALKTFGYTEEELLGKSSAMLYENSSQFKLQGEKVFDELSEKSTMTNIINFRGKNDKVFQGNTFSAKLFDSHGTWIGNFSLIHDISEKQQAEKALNVSKIKLAAALNSMNDAVFITDQRGQLIEFNEAFATFHKYPDKASCPGTLDHYFEIFEAFLPDGTPALEEQLPVARALKGESATNNEYLIRRKDTGETWYSSYSYSPTRDSDGNIIGSVVVARDITETKKAKSELIKAKVKAEESDQLKTIFLQNISHEIRTPMNAIIGFTELLCEAGLSEKKQHKYKDIIVNSSNQLLSIVNDILTISILETQQASISKTSVDIIGIVNEMKAIFTKIAATKKLAFNIEGSTEGSLYVETDDTKLRQILTNLLANAFKFTRSGSVTLGYATVDNVLTFFVKDTGIGIHPSLHQKIFERFHRTEASIKENFSGTGLGLSISKEFIEMLGGTILLESEEGHGATFRFSIPIEFTETANKTKKAILPQLDNMTILVAEDAKLNYLLIKTLLAKRNATLVHAWNGKEAIELYEQHPETALIIMDLNMPIMDGYEATNILREKYPQLPIIAFSAYTLPQEIEKAKAYGFDAYLTKPIKIDELDDVLGKFCKPDRNAENDH